MNRDEAERWATSILGYRKSFEYAEFGPHAKGMVEAVASALREAHYQGKRDGLALGVRSLQAALEVKERNLKQG